MDPQTNIFFKLFEQTKYINNPLFKIIKLRGTQCKDKTRYSRTLPEQHENIDLKNFPCCLIEYIYKVYAALKKDKSPIANILILDHLTTLIIKLISPNKFKVGGAAILPALNKNHHSAILGIKFNNPFLINKLREPTRSYAMFAKQNNPEEHNP